jgi:putative component of toxin-antitoxin plasmid stabilization module
MKRQTGRFTASGDDGRQYTVYIYTDVIDAGTFGDPNAVVEGLKELRTSDGMAVNHRQKGEYQVVQTGVVLRSSSPDAP